MKNYQCISEAGGEPVTYEAVNHLEAAIRYFTDANLEVLQYLTYSGFCASSLQVRERVNYNNLPVNAGVRVYAAKSVSQIDYDTGRLYKLTKSAEVIEGANANVSLTIREVAK